MRMKKAFLRILAAALIMTVIYIYIRAYYVAIALIVGTLIMGYREFWSLLRARRRPPGDESVKENTTKSIRNGFIFTCRNYCISDAAFQHK